MKKSLFTVLLCFLSVFCPFLLAGCGESQVDAEVVNQTNAFRIMRQANDDGSIAVAYIFPINSEIFLQNGLTQNDVNAFRYFLSLNVRAVAEQNRLRAGQGVKVSPVAEFTDIDGFAFSITFADIEAQKEFFGVQDQPQEEEDSSSSTKTSGFFMKKTEISTTFPVSTTQGAENLKQVCTIALTNWASAADYADVETLLQMYEKSNFMYYFSSTQSAIKSELCFDDGVLHHNVFIKSAQDIADGDTTITFYTTQPNTPVWYAAAVVVTLLGMLVAYFALRSRQNAASGKGARKDSSPESKQK